MTPPPSTPPEREYPGTAVALSIAGGTLIALVGALVVGTYSNVSAVTTAVSPLEGALLGFGGLATGIGIVACALLLRAHPRRYPLWGALITTLAIVSLIVAAGGLLAGFILAIVGAIMTLAWTPSWERKTAPIAPNPPTP